MSPSKTMSSPTTTTTTATTITPNNSPKTTAKASVSSSLSRTISDAAKNSKGKNVKSNEKTISDKVASAGGGKVTVTRRGKTRHVASSRSEEPDAELSKASSSSSSSSTSPSSTTSSSFSSSETAVKLTNAADAADAADAAIDFVAREEEVELDFHPPAPKKAKKTRLKETNNNDDDSLNNEETAKVRKSRIKEEKICWVCGDKALGFNFDAISCESCKAFFRRNANKNCENWKCIYESKCEIDVKSRRFCQICRLEKCFRVGMRKEWILKEAEKKERKEKIQKNKEATHSGSKESSAQPEGSWSPRSTNSDDSQSTSSQELTTRRTLSLEDREVLDSILLNFQLTVMRHIHILRQEKMPISNEKFDSMYALLNATHEIVRGFIRFAKTLKPFLQLSQEDQIGLLKGGMIECIIFSSAMMFDVEKRCWKDSNLNPSILLLFNRPEILPDMDIAAEHSKFMLTLLREPQPDNTSIILLMVLCLFAGDRPHLSAPAKDFINNWQCRYTEMLSLYLSSVYGSSHASLLLPRLLMTLTSVRSLHALHSRLHLDMNQEQIDPLLVEVYDINRILKSSMDALVPSEAAAAATAAAAAATAAAAAVGATTVESGAPGSVLVGVGGSVGHVKRSETRLEVNAESEDVKPDLETLNQEKL